ncbi:iron ABC transporter permease [Bacillus swezeyi]|uniref:Iron ABC transporter n=1 Tax=Bacillus swezeyi TaxID=1925020 RepID=A0A1R1Q8C9_9BACI|nr:iron ABC transporter permease [Bacillus swezeyi]MEC1259682.1 iron ABC transporter permease [Bacillus swezeyi]MED1739430.1 iron ABC transporter permease [Bacillus swezeyi]MED2927355.1 iron ABC transporter permease [Bacillus swezeyi]MED2941607.1 iron ABC transporter permease [Bacillus swezeyi]MED2962553.1 iron ABC transporter permease [Bacillus swezeyi]
MLLRTNKYRTIALLAFILILIAAVCASVVYGYTNTSWTMAYQAFTDFSGSNEHLVLKNVRLPRALIAATVGASLGVAGALMQAMTKNPLASPGIFGVNAGAGFFVVGALFFFNVGTLQAIAWISFFGAAFAALVVYFVGSLGREGLTPVKLTLAGAAMSALFSSLTQGMLSVNEAALEQALFWLAGSVQGRDLSLLISVLPYIVPAFMISFLLSPKINVLTMGEDVAKSLGQKTWLIKALMALSIILLAGGSVAVAGPIGFIGIVIPHFAKFIVGNDHRWILPFCAVLGAILLVTADIGARYLIMPEEVPVGVMTAIIGTPIFVYIARRGFQN